VALNNALVGGGSVTFNCGTSPVTITVTRTIEIISADTTIDGGGLITISGGNSVVVFVKDSVNFTVQNLTIANGYSSGSFGGGGIVSYNSGTLTVTNSTFSGNSSAGIDDGGGIASYGNGPLTVTNSTFSGNTAGGRGGGIFNTSGTLTVTNSTFSSNSATGGGGIFNVTSGPLTVTNSTFSSNEGGGIYNSGTLTVTNCTFSGNSASQGGGIYNSEGAATVTNTIVANSTSGGNCFGTITDSGHNIDDGTTCGFSTANGSLSSTNPQLDPAGLKDNGGPTQTIALEAGSPAVNAGNESVCAAPPVNNLDQRGYPRPGMGATSCSIGAYEYNLPGACCQCPTSCAAPINGSCAACTVVFGAVCESGQLCVEHTATPTPTITLTPTVTPVPRNTPTPTNTPGSNDCCQCATFCGAPVVGTCGGCAVVLGASCTGGSLCVPRTPTPTPIACVGDCNGNGVVTIDEILTIVNIALGNADATACPNGIPSGAQVDVALILTAVNNALNGC
jgi:predicted outer membrane repeat protein